MRNHDCSWKVIPVLQGPNMSGSQEASLKTCEKKKGKVGATCHPNSETNNIEM